MPFQPYNPFDETSTYRRRLPHWNQEGVTYFVTFRLADSLPPECLVGFAEERLVWLLARGMTKPEELATAAPNIRMEYARTFNAKWHAWLDAGQGSCVLREASIRSAATEAVLHFHGVRMELDAAVIMPNHVHLLIQPFKNYKLGELLHSIKRFSARKINALLNRKGALWLDENYDHIVRSEAQLNHYRRYIAENPARGRLHPHEYWHRSPELDQSGAGFASG